MAKKTPKSLIQKPDEGETLFTQERFNLNQNDKALLTALCAHAGYDMSATGKVAERTQMAARSYVVRQAIRLIAAESGITLTPALPEAKPSNIVRQSVGKSAAA